MTTTSVYFIDSRVADYQILLNSLPINSDWFVLNANQDGVEQMSSILANYSGLDSIQVISHGAQGSLYLGSTVLSNENIKSYSKRLGNIGNSLSSSGDLLVYGCHVAQGSAGQAFISLLANSTGADVAASDNPTGNGGDWTLEYRLGEVESQPISVSAYQAALATYDATPDDDIFIGGEENDYMSGGAGNDTLYGWGGNDTLDGGTGTNQLYGGDGDDTLDSGTGISQLDGGDGNDFYIIRSRRAHISDSGGSADSALVYAIGVAEPLQPDGWGSYINPIEDWQLAPGVVDVLPYWVTALTYSDSENSILDRVGSGANTLYYYFPNAMPAETYQGDAAGWSTLKSQERNFVRQAFSYISSIVNLHFVEASDATAAGTITIAANQQPGNYYGSAYLPDQAGNSSIYYDVDYRSTTFTRGSDVLHEIGHALGLKHSFSGSVWDLSLSSAEDTLAWTVMSYRGGARANFAYSPLDIATLQALYGPSQTSRTGNDSYVLKATATNLIWDGGGTDLLDGSALTANADISLMEGYWGYIGAQRPELVSKAGSVTINIGTVIENASGGSGNDKIMGSYVDNILAGNAGNDTLDGLGGNDTLRGGAGSDIAVFHGLQQHFEIISDGSGNYMVVDTRPGRGGADTISGIERLQFDDTIVFFSSDGNDSITGTDSADSVDGKAGDDSIWGLGGDDSLTGGIGDDQLDGGAGIDTLKGGAGNDTYLVDDVQDVVDELDDAGNDSGGKDLVKVNMAGINQAYSLAAGIENATLINTVAFNLTGNALDNVLTGNAAANTLTGGDGIDSLDGMGGADTMIGGNGDDTYVVDHALDLVTEESGIDSGIDTINSAINFNLEVNGANVENLTLIRAVAIYGTGNGLDNILTGNGAANILDGKGGADTLIGEAGADTYIVDNAGDVVKETSLAAKEIDIVLASVSFSLSNTANGNQLANVEKLTLTGTSHDHLNATGNELANTLTGNAGNNILDGGAGIDRLIGGAGNDTYIVDLITIGGGITAKAGLQDSITETGTTNGIDTLKLRGTSGNSVATTLSLATALENLDASDTASKLNLTGNASANTLIGNASDNTLIGGAGNDTLTGGNGVDVFWFGSAISASTNVDYITDFASGVDQLYFSRSILIGLGALGHFANADGRFAANATGAAQEADDRLIYNNTSGNLYYDADGSGTGAAVLIEILASTPTLTASDIWVV